MAARSLILAAVLAAGPMLAQPSLELRQSAGQPAEVRICGLASERPGDGFEIHAVESGAPADAAVLASLPPLWGEYSYQRKCTTFRPRHQPAPGMELIVSYRGEILGRLAMASAEPAVKVEEIYPSGGEIPANLLRLYVTFSGPMSLKGIEKHLHLRDAAGDEIPGAFAPMPDGLWDPDHRRLTVFLHPGRVKSGIAVGDELGPILQQGAEVELEVDAGARDAAGAPLVAGGRRRWQVGPAQKAPLDAAAFRVEVAPEPAGALEVAFPVALDRALALAAFEVRHGGRGIAGELEVLPGERRLRFLPAQPWRRGETYVLEAGARLEDAAGNRLGRAFEVDGEAKDAKAAAIEFRP